MIASVDSPARARATTEASTASTRTTTDTGRTVSPLALPRRARGTLISTPVWSQTCHSSPEDPGRGLQPLHRHPLQVLSTPDSFSPRRTRSDERNLKERHLTRRSFRSSSPCERAPHRYCAVPLSGFHPPVRATPCGCCAAVRLPRATTLPACPPHSRRPEVIGRGWRPSWFDAAVRSWTVATGRSPASGRQIGRRRPGRNTRHPGTTAARRCRGAGHLGGTHGCPRSHSPAHWDLEGVHQVPLRPATARTERWRAVAARVGRMGLPFGRAECPGCGSVLTPWLRGSPAAGGDLRAGRCGLRPVCGPR